MGEEPPTGGKSFWGSMPGILTGVAAVLTAGGTILGLVLTRDGPTDTPPPPVVTVTVEPQADASVPAALAANPTQAATSPSTQVPQSGCPPTPGAFWMPNPGVPYGPFGSGYFLAWDVFGFYVWDPGLGWVPYPDPQVRNQWVTLTGSPFAGCVAGAGSPVFGGFIG